MSEPEYLKWSPERKRRYANKRMEAMRAENIKILENYEKVKLDKKAAERKNSSVTNARTICRREVSPPPARSTTERLSGDLPRYSREWDRDKVDWNREKKGSVEVENYHHKRNQNYKTSEYEKKKNNKNFAHAFRHDEENYEHRYYSSEKKKSHKYYSNDPRNKSRYYDASSKQSRYQSSESTHRVHQSREKYKKYYPVDTKKHHSWYHSSSTSTESDCRNKKVNKTRVSNTENSALWHSDRVNEDKDRRERTLKWVKSMQIEQIEPVEDQENISTEEDNNNISPKREYDFATTSNKCLDENNHPFPQISSMKSQKFVYEKRKDTTTREESKIMEQKLSNKKEPCRKSYKKFDRINCFVHSSDNSSSDECNLDKTKSEGNCSVDPSKTESLCLVESTKVESNCDLESAKAKSNYNLESKKHDYGEKDNGRSEKINSECNLKSQNYSSGGNKYRNEKLPVSACKPSPNYAGSHPIKKPYVAGKFSSNVSREYTYNDRRNNFANDEKDHKKGFKTKRDSDTNPQYNSPDRLKSDHINRQRKFDKRQSDSSWNIPLDKNKGLRSEKYDHNKKSNFSFVPSLNQDDDHDGWGNIEQPYYEDNDGIWASADQSDIKWKISEADKTGKKNTLKNVSDGHHIEQGAKSFKVKNPTSDDDGGWSTVEEGEIFSDDDYPEENKEHVKY